MQRVTALRPYPFDERPAAKGHRVAVYDFGVKRDILRQLVQQNCEVTVYPATTHADEILESRSTTACCSRTAPAIPSR